MAGTRGSFEPDRHGRRRSTNRPETRLRRRFIGGPPNILPRARRRRPVECNGTRGLGWSATDDVTLPELGPPHRTGVLSVALRAGKRYGFRRGWRTAGRRRRPEGRARGHQSRKAPNFLGGRKLSIASLLERRTITSGQHPNGAGAVRLFAPRAQNYGHARLETRRNMVVLGRSLNNAIMKTKPLKPPRIGRGW